MIKVAGKAGMRKLISKTSATTCGWLTNGDIILELIRKLPRYYTSKNTFKTGVVASYCKWPVAGITDFHFELL